ncbi:hypothetical protein NXV65_10380 [Bacteroides fragilis]|nr:hypothetical protein [Bacteroides fragilis]
MFVATWYKNNQLSQQFTNNAKAYFDSQDPFSDYWYRFLFIDGSNATCQNEKMKKELLEEHTIIVGNNGVHFMVSVNIH